MRTTTSLALAALALLAIESCNGSHHDDGTSFSGFVTTQIENGTSDSAEPVPVTGTDFQFSEDPHAFDALFQNPVASQ